jgi:serine protease AprX
MRISLIIFLITAAFSGHAGTSLLVYFKDKGPGAAEQVRHPEKFLSVASIERRMICNAAIDETDLPVHDEYISAIRNAGLVVESASRWLNAVMVKGDMQNIPLLLSFDFVDRIQAISEYEDHKPNTTGTQGIYNYGSAALQNQMLNIDKLHDQGYTGNNVLMLLCDGGFNSVNTLNAYQYLRSKNRIKGTRDFVTGDNDVYQDGTHGEDVFSIIAAYLPGTMIGAAFDADFILARTENESSETHAEEYNWARAAEWADSMGVRIIQTSLGYSNFDPGQGDYTPQDMDGRTAIITRAAVLATRKGILVVNSAGNEGNNSFRKITAPSDADSILCVGAVDFNRSHVGLSSHGPSADGRVKPDVCAMGGGTAYYVVNNTVAQGYGTSFAAPLISGLCACLFQKYNLVTNIEMADAVRRSADRFNNPDSLYGYGIPDAMVADTILKRISAGRGVGNSAKNITPVIKNTISSRTIYLNLEPGAEYKIEVYNISAQLLSQESIRAPQFDISTLLPGEYFLKINGKYIGRFMKTNP